jgi:hypothetical protein
MRQDALILMCDLTGEVIEIAVLELNLHERRAVT